MLCAYRNAAANPNSAAAIPPFSEHQNSVEANVNKRKIAPFAAITLLPLGLSFGGCDLATAASSLTDARAQASIFDPPQPNRKPPIAADERLKMQKELNAVRDRQIANSKAKAAPTRPAKP
jgi:hypothetical protein